MNELESRIQIIKSDPSSELIPLQTKLEVKRFVLPFLNILRLIYQLTMVL